MKKNTLIGLLLALACLLCACSKVPEDQRIPVYDYTLPPLSTESAPSDPQQSPSVTLTPSNAENLIGKWHSASAATVFEFFADGTMKVYYLAPGYFEYNSVEEGTYTYDGLTLSCKLPSQANFTYSCSVNENELKLTVSYQSLVFDPVTELPNEHPRYDFPDFDELVQDDPLTTNAYLGNTYEVDFSKDTIRAELGAGYWKSVAEADRIKLETGTAQIGNLVNIDFVGKLDGVAFSGGSATSQVVQVKDGTGYIDGFCIGIAGHAVGQTFDVHVTFPENYGSADLAGKEVVFTMTLNWIYATDLTDEIAEEKGYESADQWVDEVYLERVGALLWEKIENLKEIEVPLAAYQFFHQYNLDSAQANALYYFNNDLDAYLEYCGITRDSLLKDSKEIARKFYQAAQIVAKHQLVADDALTEKLTNEYLESYKSSGYTEEQAKELLETKGKTEFAAQLNLILAQNYFAQNNTFTFAEN